MLSFFKKNDPYRIVGLILILLITRVVFFLFFNEGLWALDVNESNLLETNTLHSGPLANLLFVGLASLNSQFVDAFLAGILILLNGIQLNSIFIRNASLQESTYVPAAIYVILLSASESFYHLSPELVGSSFLLIALNYLFYHIKYRGTEENILSTGFTIGLAGLCYYPFVWVFLMVLTIYLLYSGTITRRYFLFAWGFFLPLLITWLIFFILDRGGDFLDTLFIEPFNYQVLGSLLNESVIVYGFTLLLSLIAAIQHFSGQGMTNHQILVQKAMSWVGFFGLLVIAVFGTEQLTSLVLIIPAMAYFVTKLLSDLSKKYLAELLFIGLFGIAIATMVLGY